MTKCVNVTMCYYILYSQNGNQLLIDIQPLAIGKTMNKIENEIK
jgi:hypothetical protein